MTPFMRWAGGKRWLSAGEGPPMAYVEPFVGSGAWFIDAMSRGLIERGECFIGDLAPESHAVWRALRANPVRLAAETQRRMNRVLDDDIGLRQSMYNELVSTWNVAKANAAKANGSELTELGAMALAINRLCFKGLLRVNRTGDFNTSYGHLPNPSLDQRAVIAVGQAMQRFGVEVIANDWQNTLTAAMIIKRPGRLVVDPPYAGTTHTAYTQRGWTGLDRVQLSVACQKMNENGWHVLATDAGNADAWRVWSWGDPRPLERPGGMSDGAGSGRDERLEIVIRAKPFEARRVDVEAGTG